MDLDNDLMTLWLRAGSMTAEEVRGLLDEVQDLRNTRADLHAKLDSVESPWASAEA